MGDNRASGPLINSFKRATDPDARAFAPYLRMETEVIRNLPEYHFACAITGVVEPAVSITVPYGQLDREPKMTEARTGVSFSGTGNE